MDNKRTRLDNSLTDRRARLAEVRRLRRSSRDQRSPIHEVERIKVIQQPQSQFFVAAVPPGQTTKVRLAGGKYCLGTESTVPYISLEGGGMAQKVISWGEMVEVPAEQMITIKNESYHQGDIAVNSGWDYATRPGKITVPFPLLNAATGEQINVGSVPATPFTVSPGFPMDTRLAKRAWVQPDLTTDADDLTFAGVGRQIKHSFPASALANLYLSLTVLPAFTAIGPIDAGAGFEVISDLPMALADEFSFQMAITDFGFLVPVWFYIIEYN